MSEDLWGVLAIYTISWLKIFFFLKRGFSLRVVVVRWTAYGMVTEGLVSNGLLIEREATNRSLVEVGA